jgi:aminopeptidase N
MTQIIRLVDYTPPSHTVERVALTFHLHPTQTRVIARIRFSPNRPGADLRLDGEGLVLLSAALDGRPVELSPDATGLTLPAALLPDGPFDWEAEVQIDPKGNTALEGLYLSGGMFCTQCEAEGFRRITFYPDRPDVMAPFRVRIESDLPVLLSNGNLVAQGQGWAEWDDPHPKPSYLFALVAGDLVATRDSFTTGSGRKVELGIWVRPGDEDKTAFAMDALKRSMLWDEQVYGREYDLDVFNIVAVDDFNMGAMENKGLNIFNSKYILASPQTATDSFYAAIERIVAHEYFHNWTGNRVTCRDWFQLSLKEGLTVYRDQQFMADTRGAAVQRISELETLRGRQYAEDAGPLAHPVRPAEYQEINNFYTATVYEKGAEVVRMLALLVGEPTYRKALDLYFERHDGQACTIEDWLAVFAETSGRDLSQFKLWYEQAGTPRLTVTEDWDGETLRLSFAQSLPPTPGQPQKAPQVIPVAMGLIGADGTEVAPTQVLALDRPQVTLAFKGLTARPVPSLLRGGSAPVRLDHDPQPGALAHLLAHDTDPVARWDAGNRLAFDVLTRMVAAGTPPDPAWLGALAPVLGDDGLDPTYRALMLRLPGDDRLAAHLAHQDIIPDPDAIRAASQQARKALATRHVDAFRALVAGLAAPGPFSPDAASAGRRALRNAALGYVTLTDDGRAARAAFANADNMTDRMGALHALLAINQGDEELDRFLARFRSDPLVMDGWFSAQAQHATPELGVDTVARLAGLPEFDWTNPNRFRALFGGFAGNHAAFHRADGAGYDLLADWLIRLDARNPQFAARMSTAFESWQRYDPARQALMRTALNRIAQRPGLSRDMTEMTGRMLG